MSLMLMSSCNGTYDDWANPQHNDPEDAITIPGFTATAANAIDLGKAGDSVKVFSLSSAAPAGWPADFRGWRRCCSPRTAARSQRSRGP